MLADVDRVVGERLAGSDVARRREHHLRMARRAVHSARYWREEGYRADAAYWLSRAAIERRTAEHLSALATLPPPFSPAWVALFGI